MSSAADFFRKFQYIISPDGQAPLTESADLQKAGAKVVKNIKAKAADDKKKEADKKKASNVKESGSEFFRKYSDLIAEFDDRDDPFSPNYKDKGEKKSDNRKVKGFAYGGSKQKDDENELWHAKTEPKAAKKKSK